MTGSSYIRPAAIGRQRSQQGFTLMEMLITVIIIFILAAISFGGYQYVKDQTARNKAKVQVGLLQAALEDYKSDVGQYPVHAVSSGQGGTDKIFDALFPADEDEEVYCTALDPEQDSQGWLLGNRGTSLRIYDPWGNEFFYRTNDPNATGTSISANPDFDLWSAGPDGQTAPGPNGEYDPQNSANLDDIRVGW